MIASSKLTKKNQTTLPRVVIDALGVRPSDRIVYEIREGSVVLYPKSGNLADLKGKFKPRVPPKEYPVSVERMHEAVQDAAAKTAAAYCPKRKRSPKSRKP